VAIFLLNRIGRKPVIWIGCAFSVVGIGLQQASHEWKLFLVGRLINGIGFGMVYTFSPVWIGELARPELRGFFLVLQNGSIALGQLIIVLAARGAETLTTEWSYKTMMVIQYALPAILLFFSYWFPESAYFLIKKGKIEAAEKALKQTYGSHDQEFLDIEMKRLTENVRFSEELLKEAAIGGPVLFQCFRGTNLRRTLTAILMITAPQFMGAFFYDGYVTYFLELIGITQAFNVTVAVFVVNLGATFLAFGLIEVLGRRALIIPGSFAITVTCLVIGICGSLPLTNKAAQWVIVVGEFFWYFF
jgi:MFS family permease